MAEITGIQLLNQGMQLMYQEMEQMYQEMEQMYQEMEQMLMVLLLQILGWKLRDRIRIQSATN